MGEKEKRIMKIVANNVVGSRPSGSPTARANKGKEVSSNCEIMWLNNYSWHLTYHITRLCQHITQSTIHCATSYTIHYTTTNDTPYTTPQHTIYYITTHNTPYTTPKHNILHNNTQ